MVFIIGRSALLGQRLQDFTEKGKELRQTKRAQSRVRGLHKWAGSCAMTFPGVRLSDPTHVHLSSQN
jgi:hypothetical protein